jgi:hypothetical protein
MGSAQQYSTASRERRTGKGAQQRRTPKTWSRIGPVNTLAFLITAIFRRFWPGCGRKSDISRMISVAKPILG